MTYTERSNASYPDAANIAPVMPIVEYHDRVRWGPIFAGIVVAIATQLLLSALGTSIGLTAGANGADAGPVSLGIGIWAIVSLMIALFLGSWVMASACGPMNNKTALLNGTILWATTLVLSTWLLTSGISGLFGVVASNVGAVANEVQQSGGVSVPTPDVTTGEAQQYAANTAKAGFAFLFGSLLGLVASLIGSTVGARKPRRTVVSNERVFS
ncbi:MAG: hypothetical protein WBA10_16275 [Elainellaceae cyanobacterium]